MRTGAPVQWEYLLVLPSNSSRGFERRVYGSNTAEFVNSKYHQKFLSNHHHFYAKSPFSQNLLSLGKSPISRIANLAHLYNMAPYRLTLVTLALPFVLATLIRTVVPGRSAWF